MKVQEYKTVCNLRYEYGIVAKGTKVWVGEFDKGYVSPMLGGRCVLANTPIYDDKGLLITKVSGRIEEHNEFQKVEEK